MEEVGDREDLARDIRSALGEITKALIKRIYGSLEIYETKKATRDQLINQMLSIKKMLYKHNGYHFSRSGIDVRFYIINSSGFQEFVGSLRMDGLNTKNKFSSNLPLEDICHERYSQLPEIIEIDVTEYYNQFPTKEERKKFIWDLQYIFEGMYRDEFGDVGR